MPCSRTRSLCLFLVSAALALATAAPAQAYTPPIGSDKGSVVTTPEGSPRADGIIAILIGLVRPTDGR